MTVLSFCFCKDMDGNFGLVRSYNNGFLLVQFDDGPRLVRPQYLTFP